MSLIITPKAAAQVVHAAAESGEGQPVLRVAAKRDRDGAIDYAMGFEMTIDAPVQNEAFSGPPTEAVVEEPVEPIEVSEALDIIDQSVEVETKLPVDWEKLPPGGGYERDDEGALWYSVPGQTEAWKQRSDGQFKHVPTGRSDS